MNPLSHEWIDETKQMSMLAGRLGCAMFKGIRYVCTTVLPIGNLTQGGMLGGVPTPSPCGHHN